MCAIFFRAISSCRTTSAAPRQPCFSHAGSLTFSRRHSCAWHFDVTYPRIAFMVIWALGISMIALAGLVRLPMRWIIGLGAAMIAGHNLLDPITFPQSDWRFVPWALLHDVPKRMALTNHTTLFFLYPIIPWIGVMALGYAFGPIFQQRADVRQRWL